MKEKNRIITSFTKYILLACLSMIVFTTLGCKRTLDAVLDEEDTDEEHCHVVINGPNNTVFFENDSITFSAYLESWFKREKDTQPSLTGVWWGSDIDGVISSQDYPYEFSANHSFIRSDLTLGKHIITCNALYGIHTTCSDTIYIEIIETAVGVRLPYCRLKISVEHHYDGTFGSESVSSLFTWGTTQGTWDDTVFTAIIDEQQGSDIHTTGNIEIKIDSQHKNVISFSAEQTTMSDTTDYFHNRMCQGSGPLPLTYVSDNSVEFSVSGENVSSVLQTYTSSSTNKDLISYTVHNNSSVSVEFDDFGG